MNASFRGLVFALPPALLLWAPIMLWPTATLLFWTLLALAVWRWTR